MLINDPNDEGLIGGSRSSREQQTIWDLHLVSAR